MPGIGAGLAPEIWAAIITAGCTLLLAFGAWFGRTGIVDRWVNRGWRASAVGTWTSTWKIHGEQDKPNGIETLVITSQRGARIKGYIRMEAEPDKRWELEGNFDGRFLQIIYFPARRSKDPLFCDYGCYFFEFRGEGFEGYSVAYTYDQQRITVASHWLKRVKTADHH